MLHLDFIALLVALFFLLSSGCLYYFSKNFSPPFVYFSSIQYLKEPNYKQRLLFLLPRLLEGAALCFLWIAFIDPHLFIPMPSNSEKLRVEPSEGIAIYLALDQSGSMAESVSITDKEGHEQSIAKIDLLRNITTDFITQRPHDLIGLVEFARSAQVLTPLTLDHQAILEELKNFKIQKAKDQEGTSLGYVIFKTANLISATRHYAQELKGEAAAAYTIKNTIIILVTDGLQESNPLDKGKRLRTIEIPEATAYAKQQQVRLYIINIEPQLAAVEFAPHRRQMEVATELTGGKFYLMQKEQSLAEIYAAINQLEKTGLSQDLNHPKDVQASLPKKELPHLYTRLSFYPFLIFLGVSCLLCSFILKTVFLRRIP